VVLVLVGRVFGPQHWMGVVEHSVAEATRRGQCCMSVVVVVAAVVVPGRRVSLVNG
jgi:hypothetical protein